MDTRLSEEEINNLKFFSSPKVIDEYYDNVGLVREERRIVDKYFTKNATVLDIGCGAGRTTAPLFEAGFNVIGIDLSEAMIDRAKARFPHIDFRVGNACDLQFPDESVDYVLFSFNGIDCIYPEEKRIQALKEINRVLKPGGLFVFSSHNSWSYDLFLEILTRHLKVKTIFFKYLSYSNYMIVETAGGRLIQYYVNPLSQKIQLRDCGFHLLEVKSMNLVRFPCLSLFCPWPYYVAVKKTV